MSNYKHVLKQLTIALVYVCVCVQMHATRKRLPFVDPVPSNQHHTVCEGSQAHLSQKSVLTLLSTIFDVELHKLQARAQTTTN